MSGYVRIHRSLIGHAAFRNDAEAMAFAWLIANAQWRPMRVRYKERGIYLERGQLAISQRDMARALDRDKAWVERLWKRLKAEAMIEVECEAGVAVITICNYNEYQADCTKLEAVGEALREAYPRQGQGTEQEREKGKKEEGEANASHGRIVSAWNEMAETAKLPRVRSLNSSRKGALRLRQKEHGLDAILEAIAIVGRSPWLKGEGREGNWRPTIDFILQPSSLLKVLEGAYGGLEEQKTRGPQTLEEQAAWYDQNAELCESAGRIEAAANARAMAEQCRQMRAA